MTTPRMLGQRYEVGEVLGRGGMAEVHRGRDIRLGREVAIKVLRRTDHSGGRGHRDRAVRHRPGDAEVHDLHRT